MKTDNVKIGFALTCSPLPNRTWVTHVHGKDLTHKEFITPEGAIKDLEKQLAYE